MRIAFDSDLKAHLSLDDTDRVRQIDHHDQYWVADQPSPLQAAIAYVRRVAPLLRLPSEQLANLHQRVSYLDPREQGTEYRLLEEKSLFDSTVVGFVQTQLNVPVWRAGLSVTVKHGPLRIVSAADTSQPNPNATLPPPQVVERHRALFRRAATAARRRNPALGSHEPTEDRLPTGQDVTEGAEFVRKLVHRGVQEDETPDEAQLIRTRFYVYRYDAAERFPGSALRQAAAKHHSADLPTQTPPTDLEMGHDPVLPLPPVPDSIMDGRYYLVAEVTFTFTTAQYGHLNWLALVELETDAVLFLRALGAGLNGMVFTRDPISATGVATNTSDQSNAVLNPRRTSVLLSNLATPVMGVQSLQGTYVTVVNVENPAIAAPTRPAGTDFDYDVRTNDFAAVNAYYHVDRFFDLVQNLGFPISTYFNATTFPVRADHRGMGVYSNTINAHCIGDGMGGIGHVCYALNDTTNIANPVGRACDFWVHWHELGGHGVLYEHVDFANFGFSHSAGDSLAAILNAPDSLAPDRFQYAPWRPLSNRRFDRGVAAWAWGSAVVTDAFGDLVSGDDRGYGSEQILATTLFRVYRSIGGDSADLARRRFASRMMAYLILRTISTFTPATNPGLGLPAGSPIGPTAFASAMMAVDLLNWTSEGIFGGAYNKVVRWSFERQGLYQAAGAPTPVTTPGQPPAVDVYIDDGRAGEYPYQAVHWNNANIWNRTAPDGGVTHDPPVAGVASYAYVKIRNRGTQTAHNVRVRGYHSLPMAGVSWPTDLQPFTTAEVMVGTLQGNNMEERIVGPFTWTPVVNAWGHDCMMMVVSADGDASNVDNFTAGEWIADWRLVPNDNNIGQRNVVFAPGGGGGEALMQELDGASFWVGNPGPQRAAIELRVELPRVLYAAGWRLLLDRRQDGDHFELAAGEKREVFLRLHPGGDVERGDVEGTDERDIVVSAYADGVLIGGMTYRLAPEITASTRGRGRGRRRAGPFGGRMTPCLAALVAFAVPWTAFWTLLVLLAAGIIGAAGALAAGLIAALAASVVIFAWVYRRC